MNAAQAGATIDRRLDLLHFEGVLPADNRIHTVDVRDVGVAFASATTAKVSGEVLLIAGDDTHCQRHGDLTPAVTAAIGLEGVLPEKRPGDPSDDSAWFHTDWMDCTRAQSLLAYQHYSWPDMMAELRDKVRWKRPLIRLAAPLARRYLNRSAPPSMSPGNHAQPWQMIRAKWGDYTPDPPSALSSQ